MTGLLAIFKKNVFCKGHRPSERRLRYNQAFQTAFLFLC